MALHKRPLGKSGLEITTVGVGTWAIGGGGWSFGWGQQDDDASIAAIHRGVELGINWIDTAAIYGLGHSEEVVREAVRGISPAQKPLIFTKCGLAADRSKPFETPRRDLRPESIRRECEASLRRLGVERIDLYQFHWPDESTAGRGVLGRNAAAQAGGQGARGGRLELHRGSAGALRTRGPRGLAAATFFDDSPRDCGGVDSLVRQPWHRSDRLQPDAIGPADGSIQRRARRRIRRRTTGGEAMPNFRRPT